MRSTTTLPRLHLCYGAGHAIPITSEALDKNGFGTVLCATCAHPFRVRGRKTKHHGLWLVVPEH